MARDTITKSEVFEAYTGAKAYAKRALPTLDTILKVASLITQLRPAVEESDQVRLMMAAKAEHVTNPMTGQDVVKSPDLFNAEMFKAMRLPVSITRVRVRLTKSDLPRLPDFSDDAEKNRKAVEARQELANEIAQLGPFFIHESQS